MCYLKELVLNACSAPFGLKGSDLKISFQGSGREAQVLFFLELFAMHQALGNLSCICSVQASPNDVGGAQSLTWHNGYVNVMWVPCTFAWGILDGGTFQNDKVYSTLWRIYAMRSSGHDLVS